jgi:exopolysaccharide production protein ExoY
MIQEVGILFGKHPSSVGITSFPDNDVKTLGNWKKRLFDVVFASILLILLLPVLIITAAAIKLCDGGPVFFSHTRVGFLGHPFGCLKFRTMAIDADRALATHLASDEKIAVEWSANHKLRADPRLISIGAALRRSSLDELPQLINIVRGEMSIVGPRPIVAQELAYYGGDAALLYLGVRPGLTGAWQVSGRSDMSYASRVQIDKNYCLNWSMLGDMVIIMKTIPAVMFARGSY